jgi:hypothetical protein
LNRILLKYYEKGAEYYKYEEFFNCTPFDTDNYELFTLYKDNDMTVANAKIVTHLF